MYQASSAEERFENPAHLIQTGWDEHLARWVSVIGSPPLTATAAAFLSLRVQASPLAWRWLTLYSLLVVLVPLLYVVWLFKQRKVADLDLRRREQRTQPLLVTLAGAAAAGLSLYLAAGPTLLVILAGANGLQAMLFLGINRHWKISVHAAAAGMLAGLAWLLIGSQAMLFITMGVSLIAWSRVRLGHHTVSQTIAGAALGSSLLVTIYLIYGG